MVRNTTLNDAIVIVRDSKLFADMYREVAPRIAGGPWHWFAYHFGQGPSHPFVVSIVEKHTAYWLFRTG
jgi:hypothetical protein